MTKRQFLPLLISLMSCLAGTSSATTIDEILEPPTNPGGSYSGTFLITPSQPVWAFGVGNAAINDVSISGIKYIDGLEANDHWIATLISQASWAAGYSFESIRPIGATPPSAFFMDTSSVAWQWGSSEYVAFYWLYEAGPDAGNPQAVLQAGTAYDAFRFFASSPASPFAAFGASDGGPILTGETVVTVVPEPTTASLLILGMAGLAGMRRRQVRA